jgi:hypothetical protein
MTMTMVEMIRLNYSLDRCCDAFLPPIKESIESMMKILPANAIAFPMICKDELEVRMNVNWLTWRQKPIEINHSQIFRREDHIHSSHSGSHLSCDLVYMGHHRMQMAHLYQSEVSLHHKSICTKKI